jgi:UTP--glucose-1-phosphate uridylyltransferase
MVPVIKKLIIPAIETDDALFPLTRFVSKELLPVGDVPVIQRVVNEAIDSRIEEVVFILSSEKKCVFSHFTSLEKLPPESDDFKKQYESVNFSFVTQKKNASSGNALFKAREKVGEDSFALSFPGSIFYGQKSSLEQLYNVYRTSEKQVAAIKNVTDEEVKSSFIVKTEKIANRFYKIKKVVKNPEPGEIDSRLALAGRYIFTPAVFDYLKNSGTRTTVVDVLNDMIAAGKTVYGHECDGSWHSVDDKEAYLKTQEFFLSKE